MANRFLHLFRKADAGFLALSLMLFYVFTIFWKALGFSLNLQFFSGYEVLLSLLSLYIAMTFLFIDKQRSKEQRSRFFINSVYLILILALSNFLAMFLWDNSYDGQTYRLQTIHEIIKGWNPFTQLLSDDIPNALFINHYAKSFEYFGASITGFTKNFESSKLSNIIIVQAALFLCFFYFRKFMAFSTRKALLYSALLVFNPVVTTQLFSLMFDGQIALLMLISGISFLLYLRKTRWAIVSWSAALLLLAGLKFTGLVYGAMIAFFCVVYLGIMQRKRIMAVAAFSLITGASLLFSALVINKNPYFTNITQGKHLFYPLMGEQSVNIMQGTNAPKSFDQKNRFEKFWIANTAVSSNIHGSAVAPEPISKLPFVMQLKEWTVFKSSSVLYGAMGPLFYLGTTVALLLLLLLMFNKPVYRTEFIFLTVVLLATVFINPECWLPRYVPQLWYLPIVVLLFSECQPTSDRFIRGISNLTLFIFFFNAMVISLIAFASVVFITAEQRNQYSWLKKNVNHVRVLSTDFISTDYRLKKNGITFEKCKQKPDSLQQLRAFQPVATASVLYIPNHLPPYTPIPIFKLLESKIKQDGTK